jgi:hypothetical protein
MPYTSAPGGSPSAPMPSGPGSPGASISPTACADAAKLKTSINDLRSVNVLAGGLSGVATKVQAVQTNLDTLKKDSQGQFSNQVAALKGTLSTLKSSVDTARANPGVANVSAVAKDIAAVVSTYKALDTAVTTACGSK